MLVFTFSKEEGVGGAGDCHTGGEVNLIDLVGIWFDLLF